MPLLTPIAAACLVVLMSGAIMTHLQRGESFGPPLLLGALSLIVAMGRWRLSRAPAPEQLDLEHAAHSRSR